MHNLLQLNVQMASNEYTRPKNRSYVAPRTHEISENVREQLCSFVGQNTWESHNA